MIARLVLAVVIGAIVGIDLATKAWALALPAPGLTILPFFDLRLSFNTGVSFGMFAADGVHGYVVLIVLTLVIATFFFGLACGAHRPLERAGYGAIVGGAMGNLLDRLPDGMVTDFLDLHAGGWHFPTFNLADIAISVGAGLLLLAALRRPRASGTA